MGESTGAGRRASKMERVSTREGDQPDLQASHGVTKGELE